MKKLILSSLALSLLSTSALAADPQWFVGGGLANQNDMVKDKADAISFEGSDIAYQIKAGTILEDTHRITAEFNYSDNIIKKASKAEIKQQSFLISYDYLIPLNNKFNVFAGLTTGMSKAKLTFSEDDYKVSDSFNKFTWGGQVGADYNINENFTASLSYRILHTDGMKTDFGFEGNDKVKFDVESRQIMLGAAYKF